MSSRLFVSAFILICAMFALAAPARAGLVALSENTAAGDATFTIDFGHVPDLVDVDAMNRPADAFLIEIAGGGTDPLLDPSTIVRSDEVQFVNAIVVRDAAPPDLSDPHAGGWGAERGTVPFTVKGNDVSFTAPLQVLGVPNGRFTYAVTVSQFGSESGFAEAESVPLPPAILTGLAMLVFGIAVSATRQIVHVRATQVRKMIYMPC